MVSSYRRLTGKSLLPALAVERDGVMTAPLRLALWNAPFALVAHGVEADPIFFYGNRVALALFEMDFEEFTSLPSRCSAEPVAQEARAAMLEKVNRLGFIDDYSGMRITKSGKRFMIEDATIWNLLDTTGCYHGQAAVFVEQHT
jgi:hypothetical protein